MTSKPLAILSTVLLTLFVATAPAEAAANPPDHHVPTLPGLPPVVPVCPGPGGDNVRCHSYVTHDGAGKFATATPTGLSPATIKSVYGFSTSTSAGATTTIAIVVAYDYPTAEKDLNFFSGQFSLPACKSNSGCFKKVDQRGGTTYPRKDQGWALEAALDTQWAHAIAPGAKILLVEADTNSYSNLLTAVDYAKKNAQYVSMSWGSSEFSSETSFDSRFVQTGVSFFASSGDSGLPASYPSSSPNLVSVGGTTLNFDTNGTFTTETGWSGSGGGCSAYETANSSQSSFAQYGQVNCGGKRATPDVSLDADPASGVSVYDSTGYQGQVGWFKVGGTSASAPMWAGRSADTLTVVNAAYVYANNTITFRDITSGNNGVSCLPGYDLVTGRGSWIGSTP